MSIIVEDGTGTIVGANSYASVAEAKVYWDDRNFDYTLYPPDAQIARALIQATDYIEMRFGNRFRGYPLVMGDTPQALSFPRKCLVVRCMLVEGIPDALKRATFEYAKRVLTNADGLMPDPAGYDATGQLISESHVKVGPIEKTQTYEAGSAVGVRNYPFADRLLEDYVHGVGGVIR